LKKVLITGGSGLLGTALIEQYKNNSNLYATFLRHQPRDAIAIHLDLLNVKSISEFIKKISPDLIVHTAAAKDITWCQHNGKIAHAINVIGTRHLVKAAQSNDAKLIYISTDAVFDGVKGLYSESDEAIPVNTYGRTKLDGEIECLRYEKSLVIRSSFYGFSNYREKESFIPASVRRLAKGETVYAAIDRVSNPLEVSLLSKIICEIGDDVNGLLHLGCMDSMNNFEIGREIAKVFGYDTSLIKEIKFADVKNESDLDYPLNTSLNTDKASKFVSIPSILKSLTTLKSKF